MKLNVSCIKALTRSFMAIVMFVMAINIGINETPIAIGIDIGKPAYAHETETNSVHKEFHRDLLPVVSILPTKVLNDLSFSGIREIRCMALNNYFEAATEGIIGMQAVSQVVLNRVGVKGFPRTACDVIYQKSQFSWTNQRRLPKLDFASEAWRQAVIVAKQMYVDGHTVAGLRNALFYHADYVDPQWRGVIRIKQIGSHIFYGKKELT